MKILLINKFFFSFGGTETAFFQTAKLLQELGHEVILFSMAHPKNRVSRQSSYFVSQVDFEGMSGWLDKIRGVKRILFGRESRLKLDELLRIEKPDIAHLHNIYHHLSPAIISTLKNHGVPVVMTLHDYKMVCPAYKLFTRRRICEKCRGGHFIWCFVNKCIKKSYLKSLVCSLEVLLHRKYYNQVDRFISPSRFLISKIKEMKFSGKCTYIANFTELSPFEVPPQPPTSQILFFGRLVEEKGVSLLIEAMKDIAADCLIVGDGPLKNVLQLQAARNPNASIRFLNHQPFSDLEQIIRRSSMVIVPSIWYENNPFTIIEAFALGIPVVAARIGGIPELVIDQKTGLLFTAGDSAALRDKIVQLLKNPEQGCELVRNARLHLERHFHPALHAKKLLELYQELIEANTVS